MKNFSSKGSHKKTDASVGLKKDDMTISLKSETEKQMGQGGEHEVIDDMELNLALITAKGDFSNPKWTFQVHDEMIIRGSLTRKLLATLDIEDAQQWGIIATFESSLGGLRVLEIEGLDLSRVANEKRKVIHLRIQKFLYDRMRDGLSQWKIYNGQP